MSVFGVDLGNLYSTVSIARRGGIDVIINEVSKRETATYVSFGNEIEGRMIGEKGNDMKIRNLRNTVNNLKRLVGLKFGSAEWETEREFCTFRAVEGKDGSVCVEVDFEGETRVLRPEQLIAMMLHKLSTYADREANMGNAGVPVKVSDFVLSCPPYYSAFQRKLLAQAAEIAGLNCLTLVTEGTAVALGWGIFQELPEKEEDGIVVQFCDVGHSATYISTVKFWRGHMKVLKHVYDKNLGCRNFDMALADYFRKEIQAKYKMDVYEQQKAKVRLLAGCEKLRYTLSANPIVALNVECIMNDVDVSFSNFKRETFDELTEPLWHRLQALVKSAAVDAPLHSVELVGGGSYMPRVRRIVTEAYGRPVSSTLNVSEAVAKGCGLIGAILSPRVRVEFQVVDALGHQINLGYYAPKAEGTESPVSFIKEINKELQLYAKDSPYPRAFDVSFERKGTFDLFVYYAEPNAEVTEANGSLLLGHWRFSDLPVYKDAKGVEDPSKGVSVMVRFELGPCGYINLTSASVKEDYEVETRVPKKKEKKEGEKEEEGEEEEVVVKTKTRRIDVTVETLFQHGLPAEEVAQLKQLEASMQRKDRLLLETTEARNAVEAYAYEFRSKAEEGGELFDFMTEAVRVAFRKACDDAVDWVYGEGENATCEEYRAKLTELREEGDAAAARKLLREELPFATSQAKAAVLKQTGEAERLLGTDTHIEKEKLESVLKKGEEVTQFLKESAEALSALPLHETPALTPAQLWAKVAELEALAKGVFATPKPQPPKDEKKAEADEAEAKKAEAEKAAAKGDAPPPSTPDVD